MLYFFDVSRGVQSVFFTDTTGSMKTRHRMPITAVHDDFFQFSRLVS